MNRVALLFLLPAVASCLHTNATLLDPSQPRRTAVPPSMVRIYLTPDDVKARYEEIALLHSTGDADWTSERDMLEQMRERAGRLGANGVILNTIREPSGAERVAGAIVGTPTHRKGRAVAIFVFPDSAAFHPVALGIPGRSAQDRDLPGRRSEGRAFALSLGATLVPLLAGSGQDNGFLAFTGVMIGPAAGHFYAGQPRRALGGILVRAATFTLLAASLNNSDRWYDQTGIAMAGAILLVAEAAVDVVAAPMSARRTNERERRARAMTSPSPARRAPLRSLECATFCPP